MNTQVEHVKLGAKNYLDLTESFSMKVRKAFAVKDTSTSVSHKSSEWCVDLTLNIPIFLQMRCGRQVKMVYTVETTGYI